MTEQQELIEVTEAVFEKMADMRIQRQLMRDRRYLHAEDAEAQSAAEAVIEAEVIAALEQKYQIA